MLIVKIALVFVMFTILTDKGMLSNVVNGFSKINYLNYFNPETIMLEILNFSRIFMLDHLIIMGLSCMLLEISVIVAFAIALSILIVFLVKESIICVRSFRAEKNVNILSEEAYPLTNKLMC